MCLLGLTWVFGLLTTVATRGHIIAIIFTLLNCLQASENFV
jgi:hypothetical protein